MVSHITSTYDSLVFVFNWNFEHAGIVVCIYFETVSYYCLFGLALIINVSQEEIFKTMHGVDYMDFGEKNSV